MPGTNQKGKSYHPARLPIATHTIIPGYEGR
jgi:hypothetical protein